MKTLTLNGIFLAAVCQLSFAATPVDLREQSIAFIQPLLAPQTQANYNQNRVGLKHTREAIDFNGTKHIRIKQTYRGYPVWRGDSVLHIANNKEAKMNGFIYQNLDQDLANSPSTIFTPAQLDKALEKAIQTYTVKHQVAVLAPKKEMMVYIDKANKAKWAFLVSFDAQTQHELARPTFIIDAITLNVLQEWNAVNNEKEPARGGGYGGNLKNIYFYTGLRGDKPPLDIERDPEKNMCYLSNEFLVIKDVRLHKTISYPCKKQDNRHNNTYWHTVDEDATITGGVSPGNDALFAASFVRNMYKDLYNVPILSKDDVEVEYDNFNNFRREEVKPKNEPMRLKIVLHVAMNNAAFNPDTKILLLGDGDGVHYFPFVSLTTVAHELSHAFTHQHAGFVNFGPAAGLNEAFSDMAAQMAEYLESHKNRWMLGIDESISGVPFRHMDNPRRDCVGLTHGEKCSIDNAKDYTDDLNPHYSNGVFNKAFYLLSTAKGWTIKMAFDVMMQANMRYWLPTSDFTEAACGVVDATKDYGYDVTTVRKVFTEVGIATKKC